VVSRQRASDHLGGGLHDHAAGAGLALEEVKGPLEGFAARFDELFGRVAQWRGFREYLAGLLAPRDRNTTLTALAGAGPVTGAQHPAVQRLQFFLSESRWDPDQVNSRRLELLADPATAPHGGGVLVIDDSGDRKDGTKTSHVGHQWLGRYGKTDNDVIAVTTVWADERLYYPVHAVPSPRPGTSRRARATRGSGPNWPSARIWRLGPGRRGSCSARWPPTARTGSARDGPQ
jgi:SRSO17 transposase